jgi:hypothetical protein
MPRVSQLSQPSEREFPLPALVATILSDTTTQCIVIVRFVLLNIN